MKCYIVAHLVLSFSNVINEQHETITHTLSFSFSFPTFFSSLLFFSCNERGIIGRRAERLRRRGGITGESSRRLKRMNPLSRS